MRTVSSSDLIILGMYDCEGALLSDVILPPSSFLRRRDHAHNNKPSATQIASYRQYDLSILLCRMYGWCFSSGHIITKIIIISVISPFVSLLTIIILIIDSGAPK